MHAAQVVGEVKGGSRSVSTTNRCDGSVRQRQARVERFERGVVPTGDLAQVNIAQCLAVKLHLSRGNALDVDHRNGSANHGRKLNLAFRFQNLVCQRHVRSAKIHSLGIDLLDTTARTNGLVVHFHAGGFVVVRGPLGINGVGKAGASASNFLSVRSRRRECTGNQRQCEGVTGKKFHIGPHVGG